MTILPPTEPSAADLHEAAARLLRDHRQAPAAFPGLPEALAPRDLSAAHAIQERLHTLLEADGWGARTGWKIGCTTEVMQRFLGIAHPCAGGMLAGGIHDGTADLSATPMHRPGVECEIAVRLAHDLPPGTTDPGALAAAVGEVFAAIEIVDDRYADFRALGAPGLIADDFFHAAAVLGGATGNWRDLDLAAVEGSLSLDGATVDTGTGAAIMGHPFAALAWLSADLAGRGRALRAGEVVLLGSIVKTRWVPRGTRVAIDLGPLGRAEARL